MRCTCVDGSASLSGNKTNESRNKNNRKQSTTSKQASLKIPNSPGTRYIMGDTKHEKLKRITYLWAAALACLYIVLAREHVYSVLVTVISRWFKGFSRLWLRRWLYFRLRLRLWQKKQGNNGEKNRGRKNLYEGGKEKKETGILTRTLHGGASHRHRHRHPLLHLHRHRLLSPSPSLAWPLPPPSQPRCFNLVILTLSLWLIIWRLCTYIHYLLFISSAGQILPASTGSIHTQYLVTAVPFRFISTDPIFWKSKEGVKTGCLSRYLPMLGIDLLLRSHAGMPFQKKSGIILVRFQVLFWGSLDFS